MEPARGSWLPWKHMHFSICQKRSSFDWLCTPVLCPTTGFGVTTDCSKHPEKPSLSVVGCSGGDGFCDLAGGLLQKLQRSSERARSLSPVGFRFVCRDRSLAVVESRSEQLVSTAHD